MIQIDQIVVLHDPLSPEREPFDLTLDEIQEFGESFFSPEFEATVYLTDGSLYSFIRAEKGWSWCELIDKELDTVLGDRLYSNTGTLEDALNELLTEVNMRKNYLSNN